jgi:hypothetical protein
MQIKTKIVKPNQTKQEANGTVILPPLVFPALTHAATWQQKMAPVLS